MLFMMLELDDNVVQKTEQGAASHTPPTQEWRAGGHPGWLSLPEK